MFISEDLCQYLPTAWFLGRAQAQDNQSQNGRKLGDDQENWDQGWKDKEGGGYGSCGGSWRPTTPPGLPSSSGVSPFGSPCLGIVVRQQSHASGASRSPKLSSLWAPELFVTSPKCQQSQRSCGPEALFAILIYVLQRDTKCGPATLCLSSRQQNRGDLTRSRGQGDA